MLIKWTKTAQADLNTILHYFIDKADKETGQELVTRLFYSVDRLVSFPLSGRAGKVPGTRELIPRGLPYLIIYQITASDHVHIINVVHTARLREEP